MRATFPFTAGALVRKEAIFQLRKAAQSRGLAINISDDGGWFQTEYCVTVEGDESNVQDYVRAVKDWATGVSTG